MLALLTLCHPFVFLCFYASLKACLHVHAWVYVSSILQSNGTMDTRSKPTFVFLGHPLCLITCLFSLSYAYHALFAPVWLSLLVCSLQALTFSLISFFTSLLAYFFCLCMYTYGVRTHGARAQPLRWEQKGQRCELEDQPWRGQCSIA